MRPLPELQARLAAAVLGRGVAEVARAVIAEGLSPEARIQVYRNHVLTSLTATLEASYPVVCRLVDRRFFGFAADHYIRQHPPSGPCLHEYGEDFPGFLERFPPCAGHPYLADVARLEWAMNIASHADDVLPIEPAELARVPAESVPHLVLQTDPSASWVASPWPVDRIWKVNQPEADLDVAVDLSAGSVRLEIRRRDDVVTLRRLEPAEFAFRAALGVGVTLETATAAGFREDPAFDLTQALRDALGEALFTRVTLEAADEGARA